jgi:signal transduction histidine kinase
MRTIESNGLLSGKRPLAIFGMLSLSLLLIAVLGWQSWQLQQSNDRAAESVLREYAILVADEYGRRATAELGYGGYYQLISRIAAVPKAAEMAATGWTNEASTAATRLADEFFVFDGLVFETTDDSGSDELAEMVKRLYRSNGQETGPYRSWRSNLNGPQIIYAIGPSVPGGKRIFGFVVNPVAVGEYLQRVFATGPLLPPSLAGGRVKNDLLFLEVTNPTGNILFEANRQYASNQSVKRVLGNDYQGILEGYTVSASVDPAAATSLLIGGLPSSRLPLLLVVMGITTATMLTAIWLFRREQAVIKLRTDFVSQVSHELRTPLTQIRMFAETLLLDRTRTQEEYRRSLQIIDRESRRLSHLVENILRVSNIADTARVDCRNQLLAPIVKDACEAMQSIASETVIDTSIDESVAANVDADALHQVLLNVTDNAIKYGPVRQTISISLTAADGTARISIADQGPGIPEMERERVWLPFYRLKREQDTAISGTGIGLAVVRELVEAMQGTCWVDARNVGTRVNFEFRHCEDRD